VNIGERRRYKPIDASEQMTCWNTFIEPRLIEQTPLLIPPSHHPASKAVIQSPESLLGDGLKHFFDSIDPLRSSVLQCAKWPSQNVLAYPPD
jgi:hypothetical protein